MDKYIEYNGKIDSTATLSASGNYTLFQSGDLSIRFRTSPYLEKYTSILKWDNGYVECMAKYSTCDNPIEEYIDLNYIADRLRLSDDIFKKINNVVVK